MSDSARPDPKWLLVAIAACLIVIGGGGAAASCKLFLNCGIGDKLHSPPPADVSNYADKGAVGKGLPRDLASTTFSDGFSYPTDLAFFRDGRLLVADKDGRITVVAKHGGKPSTFLDLRSRVNSTIFRGVMDVTIDPDFTRNPYVYVAYTAIGKGPKSTAPTVFRISRFAATEERADPASERVIVGAEGETSCRLLPLTADCLPSEVDHVGADIAFAEDGTMFVSTGDGGGEERPERVAFLAQSRDTLNGKVLHIDRTGGGLRSNPYWNGDPNSNRSRLWAVGARNPFRLTLLGGQTSSPLIAEVGWNTAEELVFASRGANLGWPCYEGPYRTPEYSATQFCNAFYRAHPTTPTAPWIALHHPRGQSITGGVSLSPATAVPQRYRGDYVFGDWVNSTISVLPLSRVGKPSQPIVIARNAAGPSAFAVGPDGALFYLAANVGEVRRIAAASGS